MTQSDASYDIIVIGGGIAGLVAANRAAQLGKRVIVLEKGAQQQYPCNSRYTYGTFHINFSDVGTDENTLFEKIQTVTGGFAREDLARTIAKDGRRLMQWLRGEGIDLVNLGDYSTSVLSPPWRKGFGLTWKDYGGDIALRRLESNFQKRQGRVLRGTRARALDMSPPGIELTAEQAQGSTKFRAANIVIADGGFQSGRITICVRVVPTL